MQHSTGGGVDFGPGDLQRTGKGRGQAGRVRGDLRFGPDDQQGAVCSEGGAGRKGRLVGLTDKGNVTPSRAVKKPQADGIGRATAACAVPDQGHASIRSRDQLRTGLAARLLGQDGLRQAVGELYLGDALLRRS